MSVIYENLGNGRPRPYKLFLITSQIDHDRLLLQANAMLNAGPPSVMMAQGFRQECLSRGSKKGVGPPPIEKIESFKF